MNKLFAVSSIRQFLVNRGLSIRISADGKDIPKKKNLETRVTLIGPDDSVSITDLKSAENISIRRELKLVKIQDEDSKTRRPIYKLMTNAQYHEEELAKRKEKKVITSNVMKGQKLITLNTKIAVHDVMTNVNKIKKLLDKQYEVKVVISGPEEDSEKYERIYTIMERNLKSIGQILQKRNKGNSLRFQLLPLKDISSKSGDSSKDNNDDKGPI